MTSKDKLGFDGRGDVLNASKRGGDGFAVGGLAKRRGASIFYKIDLPGGKIRFIDRKVFNGALERSDSVIRSNDPSHRKVK